MENVVGRVVESGVERGRGVESGGGRVVKSGAERSVEWRAVGRVEYKI
jgi:hypothetical protein